MKIENSLYELNFIFHEHNFIQIIHPDNTTTYTKATLLNNIDARNETYLVHSH